VAVTLATHIFKPGAALKLNQHKREGCKFLPYLRAFV